MSVVRQTSIYFSDVFGVAPELLEEYGAFDVSLVNDLPLFIDPSLGAPGGDCVEGREQASRC